ncbi:MAG: flagellar biosynthetic protein FliR [Acidobacteriota bacterium]
MSSWLPDSGSLDGAFRTFAPLWGVRHGALDTAVLLFLALIRWTAIVQFCPFLGGKLVPGPVKMGLAMVMAWFTTPWLSHQLAVPLGLNAIGWWIAAFHEITIGLLIGFGSSLVFFAANMGGQFLDSVRGTTMANLLVPQLQIQTSLLGDFYFQLFVVLYVLVGGHLWFLSAVIDSYQLFPPIGLFPKTAVLNDAFIRMTGSMFGIMLKVVAPAILVLILADVILGVANRMAPQMDVFFMGMALKPIVGLLVVALSIYAMLQITPDLWRQFHVWMNEWLREAVP